MGKMTAECLLFSLLPLASHDMILIASNLNFGQMSVHPSWSMALLTPERGFMHQSCLTWFVGKITHENILIYYFCSFFMSECWIKYEISLSKYYRVFMYCMWPMWTTMLEQCNMYIVIVRELKQRAEQIQSVVSYTNEVISFSFK